MSNIAKRIGPIALFGSGETSPAAQRIHHEVMSRVDPPVSVAIIETPAGFEPNSHGVAQKIADYLDHRLQNFAPRCHLIPARMRGTEFSPDNCEIAKPIFDSNYVFMGPGSPTYAVRQLRDSFTWQAMLAQNRLGAAICFSSAATISVSKYALPVYEIYKVGDDLHWKQGLDFFAAFGLNLLITPHWNNNDGGDELDTSRCYMGQERYARLLELLPEQPTILGIEENTGVVIDPEGGECVIVGTGRAIIRRDGSETSYESGTYFAVGELGSWRLPDLADGISENVLELAQQANETDDEGSYHVPDNVQRLVEKRETARAEKEWGLADQLRDELIALGWTVTDTPDGPSLELADD